MQSYDIVTKHAYIQIVTQNLPYFLRKILQGIKRMQRTNTIIKPILQQLRAKKLTAWRL